MDNAQYKGPVCRGCWALGNNCRICERCVATKPTTTGPRQFAASTNPAMDNAQVTQEDREALDTIKYCLRTATELRQSSGDCNQAMQAIFWENKALDTLARHRLERSEPVGWMGIESAPKDGTVSVPLTLGKVAIIDASDQSLISGHTWHARPRRDGNGFYAANSSGVRMHRLLLGIWDDRIVDHINGDGLDNRRCNLRSGTQSQNCVNRQSTPGRYLRGARPKKNLWQAYIKLDGRQRSLGYFATEDEAHAAYVAEAQKLHGDWMPLPSAPDTTTPEPVAEIERLRSALREIRDLHGEINPSNYDHDDACELNRQFVYALTIADQALAALSLAGGDV